MYKQILIVLLIILWVVPPLAQAIEMNPDSIPFAPAVYYDAGIGPISVFCTDMDGDFDVDLVSVGNNESTVYILVNSGDGTFPGLYYGDSGAFPTSLFCSDVNGDGYPDLIVTCNSFV